MALKLKGPRNVPFNALARNFEASAAQSPQTWQRPAAAPRSRYVPAAALEGRMYPPSGLDAGTRFQRIPQRAYLSPYPSIDRAVSGILRQFNRWKLETGFSVKAFGPGTGPRKTKDVAGATAYGNAQRVGRGAIQYAYVPGYGKIDTQEE